SNKFLDLVFGDPAFVEPDRHIFRRVAGAGLHDPYLSEQHHFQAGGARHARKAHNSVRDRAAGLAFRFALSRGGLGQTDSSGGSAGGASHNTIEEFSSVHDYSLLRLCASWLVFPCCLDAGSVSEASIHVLFKFNLSLEYAGLDHEVADHIEVFL